MKKISRNKSVFNAGFVSEVRGMIEAARGRVASAVNQEMTMLYWNLGEKINATVLKAGRGQYGKGILPTLSAKLVAEYGNGFSVPNLSRMIRLSECFPKKSILSTLSKELSWSHFVEILPIQNDISRNFYAEMCRIERWSVRTLREKIGSMLFERTALSKKPEKLARMELDKLREENKLTPDLVFRDPYFLDFLGLKGSYQEKDLESAIIRDLEKFIMEIGSEFSFIARQKRITVGGDDFYLDLLFFHRGLNRLVAIELKIDKFRPEHKGQMELYLRWLDKYERKPGEAQPIGLILCAGKSAEQIELLELGKSGIKVADYMTQLPPRKLLERRLHEAVRIERQRIEGLKI